jgi:AcrR family transcriptional regulator
MTAIRDFTLRQLTMPGVYAKLYTMSSPNLNTRDRIMENTLRLMEKRRGRDVRVDDIARAAGVSRQAVYLHFGSRAGLLIATVRYADKAKDLDGRLQGMKTATNSGQALDAYLDFWGNYIPEIHGLAKALLAVRETDQDAAAAWDDRMQALREGCRSVINCLVRDGLLAPGWDAGQAAEALWALSSVSVWENLTIECGWSQAEYVSRMKSLFRRTFVKPD